MGCFGKQLDTQHTNPSLPQCYGHDQTLTVLSRHSFHRTVYWYVYTQTYICMVEHTHHSGFVYSVGPP